MEWVKQRKLPACKAIQYNGQACHEMDDLWNALHNTYNSASGQDVDLSVLDPLPTLQERDWPPFSALELTDALVSCSSRSSPGPDHITWVHLKVILESHKAIQILLDLANACIRVGHWPKHFKDSISVIILKPGKPSYSTPKSFRPIVLLNTIGKLIKKMISNHLQFDMIKYDLVHPNQVGGVRQRSTKDARLFLTHLVRTGWAKGKKTSVVAFDIAQFFPSLNHAMLLAILRKQGFLSVVTKFFASYLVDRFTAYMWGSFRSGPHQADVGVGQGSALSPVLSALYIAPVMKLYHMNPVSLKTSLLSFVDDGTVVAQSKSLDENIETLKEVYTLLLSLFVALGLVLEHSKTEYFIFDWLHSDYSPPLDLGYAPYTGDNPLKPNLY